MLDTLTLRFWEPFFRVVKIDDGRPVKVVYGCPEGKTIAKTVNIATRHI